MGPPVWAACFPTVSITGVTTSIPVLPLLSRNRTDVVHLCLDLLEWNGMDRLEPSMAWDMSLELKNGTYCICDGPTGNQVRTESTVQRTTITGPNTNTFNISTRTSDMPDPDTVDVITFDSYTTLVDVYSQAAVLEEMVDGIENPEFISRVWRLRNMMYTVIANDIDAYRPFYEIQQLSLKFALESSGYDVPADVRNEIRRTVYKENIEVFDDVHPGMERLAELGYDLYVISNGDPDMLDHMIEQADIGNLLEDTISAHEIETFKPDPAIYHHSADRIGVPIEKILHVSGGTMRDVWGAKNAGMQAAWLNRPGKHYPTESLGEDPDFTVERIHGIAEFLEST